MKLGVTVDKLLHFEDHAKKVIDTIKTKSRSLYHIKDAPQKLRTMVSNSLVVSPASYALGVYGPFLQASKKNELQVCLNDTERLATSLPMATRLEVLHLECSTLTLERMISLRSISLLARMASSPYDLCQQSAQYFQRIPRVATAITDAGFDFFPSIQRTVDPAFCSRITYQWLHHSESITIQSDHTYTTDAEILVDAHNFNTLIFTDGSVEQSTTYVRNTRSCFFCNRDL